MSVVYEVRDPETGRPFAAKVLRAATGSYARFAREYRALGLLDHPNVVRVYRYGLTEQGAPYLVMELLDGVPAQVRVKNLGRSGDPVRTVEAVRIALHVSRALSYVHARGVVHRDLKSSNVIVLADGVVKVLDFGTIRLLDGAEHLTEPGEFVGTFHYASPEQLTGGQVTAASDLYGLGVLFYRMLTGRRPFEADTPHGLARLHLETIPPSPRELVPTIPESVSDLAMQLIAKAPEQRPADAAAVVVALQAIGDALADPTASARPLPVRALVRPALVKAARALLDTDLPGAALLFVGPDASGRGRVVDSALDEARARGCRVFPVRFGGERRPLVALAAAVAATFPVQDDGLDDEALEAWAGDHAEPTTGDSFSFASGAGGARPVRDVRLATEHAELATLLAERARQDPMPVVIGVRDLWLGAPAEVEALLSVMRALADDEARVVLFGAWLDGPLPLTWGAARTVSVPPLNIAEVAEAATRAVGAGAVGPELVRRLLAATGGRAALVEALARSLHRRAVGEAAVVIPDTVSDAIALAVEAYAAPARRVLEAVALAEGELTVTEVAWAVDEAPDLTASHLRALRADGVLVEVGGRWHVGVGIIADLVRARLRAPRRLLLCRRLADALGGRPANERIAEVLVEAGRTEEAARGGVAWAEPLIRDNRQAEAVGLLARLATARGLGAAEADVWRAYAACLVELRPSDPEAERAVRRALALAATPGARGDAGLHAARLARSRDDVAGERQRLVEALNDLNTAGDTERAALALERLAETCALLGELGQARTYAETAVRGRANGRGSGVLTRILADLGDLRRAENAGVLACRHAEGVSGLRAASALSRVLRLQGRLTEARAHVEPHVARARIEASPGLVCALLLAAARVDIDLWRLGQARERLSMAMDVTRDRPPAALDAQLAVQRARLARLSGDEGAAVQLLRDALQRADTRGFVLHAAHLGAVLATLEYPHTPGPAATALRECMNVLVRVDSPPAIADVAALAEARGMAEAAGYATLEELWGPARAWLEAQPARLARMDWLLACRRRASAAGDRPTADAYLKRARALHAQLRALLSFEDDAAMAVHPLRETLGGVG